MQTLSIIIPAYNEEPTIHLILNKIKAVEPINQIRMEIIIVNDCSTDRTDEKIKKFQIENPELNIVYIEQSKNQGKGAAIRAGISRMTGDYVIIQDADLEYDPREYNLLLRPLEEGFADVVYGSRFVTTHPRRCLFFWHTVGNKFLTFLSNAFTNLNLTDVNTCYILFKADILRNMKLAENHFGFNSEVTARVSRIKNIRIYEVGISYYGRTYAEGKKINWKDGVRFIFCIMKYGAFRA